MNQKVITMLSEAVLELHPEFHELSPKQQSLVTRRVLKESIVKALPKVHLPTPPSPIKRMIEDLRYKRTSKHYKKTHKPINYFLWDLLFNFKKTLSLNSSDSKTTSFYENASNTDITLMSTDQSNFHMPTLHSDTSNTYLGKDRFFKLKQEREDVFTSPNLMKEKLDGFETQLLESLQHVKKQSKIHDSIFELYELSKFIGFIDQLETFNRMTKNRFQTSKYLSFCYDTLLNYYFYWLKRHDIKIARKSDVIKTILDFSEFRKLPEDNPLVEGLIKLYSVRIDMKKHKISVDKEILQKTLSKSKLSNQTKMLKPKSNLSGSASLTSEIIRYVFDKKQVPEVIIKKMFLRYPFPIKNILDELEHDQLIIRDFSHGHSVIKLFAKK